METIRYETLKYFIGFTFLISLILLYAGIWSLNSGLRAGDILVSGMSSSLWAASGLFFVGSIASFQLIPYSNKISSVVLCFSVGAGIFIFLLHSSNPYGIIAFLLPILYSVFLFDWKPASIFIGLVIAVSTALDIINFPEELFQQNVLISGFVALSGFILLTIHTIGSTLEWYEKNYISAHRNEQIIRDNEVKLQYLFNDLKDYQKSLNITNELLVKARDEAEREKNTKQIFVQNVSHELRTPLNLIIGFSEAMFNTPYTYTDVNWTPELKSDIECIYQNSRHLKALIDDVLDMASLEKHSFEINPTDVDLNFIIREVVLINRDSYKIKSLYLKTNMKEDVLMVHADRVRIKQVILNLLSNALKYTNKGGVIISTNRIGGMARVNVQDTGKGIPEAALEKVFEDFYQVDKSRNREDSGTGLGLTISKQLVELHGGEMKVSSIVGKGTVISFSLPLIS